MLELRISAEDSCKGVRARCTKVEWRGGQHDDEVFHCTVHSEPPEGGLETFQHLLLLMHRHACVTRHFQMDCSQNLKCGFTGMPQSKCVSVGCKVKQHLLWGGQRSQLSYFCCCHVARELGPILEPCWSRGSCCQVAQSSCEAIELCLWQGQAANCLEHARLQKLWSSLQPVQVRFDVCCVLCMHFRCHRRHPVQEISRGLAKRFKLRHRVT